MSEPEAIADVLERRVTVVCQCGIQFAATAIVLDGKPLPSALYCPACQARRAQAETERIEQAAALRLRQAAARRELDAASEAERRREAIAEATVALEVPPLYATATLDSLQPHGTPADQQAQRAAVAFARRYLESFPEVASLLTVFVGVPGSGKGHVSWSLARAVVARGLTARMVKLPDLVRELRASWGTPGGSDDAALRRYRALDLLIVDEVSAHAFYGQPVQHLYDILDHRLEQTRPTILTSNETDGGLQRILSPALWNRIEGHGGVVDFGQASWRSRPRGVA